MNMRLKGVILLVIFFIACMGTSFYISRYKLVVYPIEGDSMEPTVHDDDRVLVYRTQNVKHGDIVIFQSDYYSRCLIKRVIGLEGDTVEIKYNEQENYYEVIRNGEKLEENYILEPMYTNYNELEVVVPEGKMFYLGDNRNCSLDSHLDEVMEDISSIEGKVIMRYNGLNIGFLQIGYSI